MASLLAHPSDWAGGGDDTARLHHRQASRETFMLHLRPSHHAELRSAVDTLTAALGDAAAAVGDEGEPSQETMAGVTAADFPLAAALAIVLMGIVSLAYLASARWLRLDRI